MRSLISMSKNSSLTFCNQISTQSLTIYSAIALTSAIKTTFPGNRLYCYYIKIVSMPEVASMFTSKGELLHHRIT